MTILTDNEDWLVERRARTLNHKPSVLQHIYVERGTKNDWDLLHELHYKAGNLGIGPIIFRAVYKDHVVGVGVMTVPKILLSGRNELFKWLRPNVDGKDNRMINRRRIIWINDHTAANSRLVVDTMFRGAGIAYRMQNLMMRMSGKRLIEFQSSMSKFNPFASKAGVRFVAPKRSSHYARGIAWFARWFESDPADSIALVAEFEAMTEPVRQKCLTEMRQFYFKSSAMEKCGNNRANGTSRVDGLTVKELIKELQQLVLASPLYGVYINPDYDELADRPRPLPARIPLLAFDNQKPSEPLDLSRLSMD